MNKKLLEKIEWAAIYRSWPGLFFILDPQLNILAISSDFSTKFKLAESDWMGKNIAELYAFYAENSDVDDLKWRLSLEYVHQSGQHHKMSPVRLSFNLNSDKRMWDNWQPMQIPVFNQEKELLYIIHRLDKYEKKDSIINNDRLNVISVLINDGIYEIDFKSEEVCWNDQLYKILGYEAGEIPLTIAQMLRMIHHSDRREIFDLIRGKNHKAREFETEYRLKKKSGEYIDVLSKGIIIRDEEGVPLKFIAAINDISHYKEQERLKARLELITSTIPAMICYIDSELRYKFLNSAYEAVYDVNLNNLVGRPVKDFIDEEAYAQFLPSAKKALAGEKVELAYSSSASRYYKSWYVPDKDAKGIVRGFIGLTMDMSKEKHKEIALNNATEEKQRLLDQLSLAHEQINKEKNMLKDFFMEAPSLIAIHEGPDYVIKYLNRKAAQMYGDHLKIGVPFKNLTTKSAYEKVAGIFDKVYHQQKEYRAKEFVVKTPVINPGSATAGGYEERYFDFVVQPTSDMNGRSTGLIIYANEVTDQVLAKRALQESAKRDRMLLETMPIIAYIYSTNGKLEYLNSKWYEFTGQSKDATFKTSLGEALHPDDLKKSKAIWQNCLSTGGIYNEYLRIKSKDGVHKWHHTRIVPVKGEDDGIIRWIGTSTDIDEQVKANEKKDEFISIASHELKTPLTSVMAYLQLLMEISGREETPVATYLGRAYKNAERLNDLIAELLDVSRIQSGKMSLKRQTFNLDEMIREVVESQQYVCSSHNIKITGETKVSVNGDRERLEQIINNLLSNGIKYSPGKDEIIVCVSKSRGKVQVDVKDFGVGISEKDQKHLFSQFYRSENISKSITGLGIGLYISIEIAKLHGGSIAVQSKEGEGSTFSLILPC